MNDVEQNLMRLVFYAAYVTYGMHGYEEKCIVSLGKYEGKRWFGRPKHRREINMRYQTKGPRGQEPDSSGSG
jgi:hypothetical protein